MMIYGDNDMKQLIKKQFKGITSPSRFAYLPKAIFEVEDISALDLAVFSTIAVHCVYTNDSYVFYSSNARHILSLLGMTNHPNGKNLAKVNTSLKKLLDLNLITSSPCKEKHYSDYTLVPDFREHFAMLPIDGYYSIVKTGNGDSKTISLLAVYVAIVGGIYQPKKISGAKEQYVDPYKYCINYRTYENIGSYINMGRVTVGKYIDKLVKRGIIVRVRASVKGAKNMITYLSTKEYAQYMYKSLLFKIDNLTVIGIYPEK